MKRINLEFDKTLTNLAGNQYGQQVFKNQVKNVDINESYELIFPSQIENIATSFIQGFFYEFVDTFGLSGIEDKVEIKSSIKNLKQIIIDCLL